MKPLFASLTPAELEPMLMPLQEWHPFPRASDRDAWTEWQGRPSSAFRARELSSRAEALWGQDCWPDLPATLYMKFVREGDRLGYETPYFLRRQNLALLALAECVEGRGRFLDELANGFWAIGGEPTWCLPVHVERLSTGGRQDELPSLARPTVDLFAAETAFALAESTYLLRRELDDQWPSLCRWIHEEINRRILQPFEQRDDIGWFDGLNNWTPWCCSSVMAAAFYTVEDPARLARITHKLLGVLQCHYDRYSDDGGCDEGPMYWTVSPGAWLLALELLYSRSGGRLDFYADPKLRAMGRYIVEVRLSGDRFVNFADSRRMKDARRAIIYRFGERIQDRSMKDLALLSTRGWKVENPARPDLPLGKCCGDLPNLLREFWWIAPDDVPQNASRPLHSWLPRLQVGVLRATPDERRGLILAAKGGHNAENHNHNDIGQFIILLDGQPGIVDVGIGAYSRATFSDQRYSLWPIRGSAHNLPVINGYEQLAGHERKAEHVEFSPEGDSPFFSQDVQSVYPEAAGVLEFTRRLKLDRGDKGKIILTDRFRMKSGHNTFTLNLYTPRQVVTRPGEGEIELVLKTGRPLMIRFTPAAFSVNVDECSLGDDALLQQEWPDGLRRLEFVHQAGAAGAYQLEFS